MPNLNLPLIKREDLKTHFDLRIPIRTFEIIFYSFINLLLLFLIFNLNEFNQI